MTFSSLVVCFPSCVCVAKIAELQSEVEKKTEELRQSSLVHESEVTRLRDEIQQKEKEVRRLRMSAADRV